jgi:hypothetical protein
MPLNMVCIFTPPFAVCRLLRRSFGPKFLTLEGCGAWASGTKELDDYPPVPARTLPLASRGPSLAPGTEE